MKRKKDKEGRLNDKKNRGGDTGWRKGRINGWRGNQMGSELKEVRKGVGEDGGGWSCPNRIKSKFHPVKFTLMSFCLGNSSCQRNHLPTFDQLKLCPSWNLTIKLLEGSGLVGEALNMHRLYYGSRNNRINPSLSFLRRWVPGHKSWCVWGFDNDLNFGTGMKCCTWERNTDI